MHLIDLNNVGIHIYNRPVDMRKAINGLVLLTTEVLLQHPQSGELFIFCNRLRDKVKMIFWDNNGFVLLHKRLEKGKFHFNYQTIEASSTLSEQQLKGLLIGIDFSLLDLSNHAKYSDFL